jgi:N-acyl-D-aspartate/D-glutamate deacylase
MLRLCRLFLLASCALIAHAAHYHVLIRNARLVDSTGNPWSRAEVADRAGRIAAIGALTEDTATRVIDAKGRVVSPAFIDVHTHIERAIENVPRAENYLPDGVTTVIAGNCGGSELNLKKPFHGLEAVGLGINVGSLIGHNTVRGKVMGTANRPPLSKELAQMQTMRGLPPTLEPQIDTILEMISKCGAQMVYDSISSKDVARIMRYRNTSIASEGGVREFGAGMPHSRSYGTNARVLGEYVRNRNILSLEDAVRRMTSLPARTFRLYNRGLIGHGFVADLLVLDPDRVQDKATFQQPHQYSLGFDFVLVSGQVALDDSKATSAMSGQIVRPSNSYASVNRRW